MARISQHQPIYDAIHQFKQRCFLGDQSLLWPERTFWTLENLYTLKDRFIDHDLSTKQSFEEKFSIQLQRDNPQLWGIASDMFFVYSLPSASMKKQSKIDLIGWAASNGNLALPPAEAPLWAALEPGYAHTGIQFHRKVGQLAFLTLLAIAVKEYDQRAEIFQTPETFLAFVNRHVQKEGRSWDRAPDMRAALAYMLYPDYFESMISMRDKQAIVQYYQKKLNLALPDDPDQALYQVRQQLSPTYDREGQPFHFYLDLGREWRPGVQIPVDEAGLGRPPAVTPADPSGDETTPDPDMLRVIELLKHTHNVILYGPPGTGKTYIAKLVAHQLIQKQLGGTVSPHSREEQAVQDLTLNEVLAIALYRHGPQKSLTVPEIEQLPLVQARFRLFPIKNPRPSIWSSLQLHTPIESTTVRVRGRTDMGWFDKDVTSRWQLTDEGKAFVETQLQPVLDRLDSPLATRYAERDFVKWVTFHQSYAYEDFIEGWRPRLESNGDEGSSFEIRRGIFKALCDRAIQDPGNAYVLVIDEINRGNMAKIMGELITLIEDDKRGFEVDLPYSSESFCVPPNLYLIGTMNTADRSIALLDIALRRRFAFAEILPRPDLLMGEQVALAQDVVALDALLRSLNAGISRLISRDLQIGHSYFLKMKSLTTSEDRLSKLEFIWNNQILPLLQEYFYNRSDQLSELLQSFLTTQAEEPDAPTGVVGDFGKAFGEDLLAGLVGIIERYETEKN